MMHGLAEPCKTNGFSSGLNGFGGGNVISNTFVQWMSSCEGRKWGWCLGVGAMGDRLAGKKYQWR